ncbi:PDZ domain-containing protein [Bacillus aerolatus]|uniref:PDZ domain-containing protein n=1 Tax=Bacillus aerolatus TaxID=2653354 RepID=A0A6I1FIZ7_9BACI|nr:PDZ domain-containing protein [Bacillus aerolatus]KAB7706488.1 PDZ domain-containing protein [Bacillus aerolatus]
MVQEWLLELLAGFGKLFIHPVFYFSFLLAFVVGMFRVTRERKDFHTRVYDIYQEIRYILPSSLFIGLLLSIAAIASGLTLPLELLNFIAAVTIILSVGGFRLLSPAWTIGLSLLIFAVSEKTGYTFIPYDGLSLSKILMTMAVLLALLLITEGLLMFKRGWQGTSPRLAESPRGLNVGVQFAQRLWLVPVFLVLPAGDLTSPWPWWPVISIGAETYAFIWFPFLVGFAQLIKSTLPELAVKATGKNIITVGVITLLLAVAAYWVPLLAVASAAFAFISRIWISRRHYAYERNRHYFFTPQPKGVMILGILPHTPAKKMDLKIGEIIYKVNNMEVNTYTEFYEALQKNAAYCKLEVVDVNSQIRFVQGSLYEGEHHGLGLILAEEEKGFVAEGS